MKKLIVLAALLMVSTAAHAGNSISFEIEGHKIRIVAPKNCDSLSCLQISAPSLSGSGSGFGFKSLKSDDDGDVAVRTEPSAPTSVTAPVNPAAAPQPTTPAAGGTPSASTTMASTSSAPITVDNVASPAPPAAALEAPTQAPIAAPVAASTTPLGIWATEGNKGQVRIEQCGQNLCGYAAKTGEKILINMKASDKKWTGRIHDPDSGRDYDSTIAMKGPNTLRVQGCAFGGMFCGGQTWNRIS
jgi:uncharacterized protein (DUF2147 family)